MRWRLVAVIEAVLLVVALVSGAVILRPRAFNPIQLPPQHTNLASYHLGDSVVVTATKCNTSHEAVTFQGATSWVTINPAGTVVPAHSGVGVALVGCVTSTFSNAMPPGVIAATEAFFAQGIEPVTWRITGVETPLNHSRSVTAGYVTNDFTIVPD
jgi:hypothetical protein